METNKCLTVYHIYSSVESVKVCTEMAQSETKYHDVCCDILIYLLSNACLFCLGGKRTVTVLAVLIVLTLLTVFTETAETVETV